MKHLKESIGAVLSTSSKVYHSVYRVRGPFLESPGNLSGPISVFGDKCFLAKVHFCELSILIFKTL